MLPFRSVLSLNKCVKKRWVTFVTLQSPSCMDFTVQVPHFFVTLCRKLQQFHRRVPATGERFLLPAWPTRPHLHAFPAQSCRKGLQVTWLEIQKSRGRILGRNPDNSLKSFPPCCSQTSLQLCIEIYYFKLTQPLSVSMKENGGKPDRKSYPLPYGLRNPYKIPKSHLTQKQSRIFRSSGPLFILVGHCL